MNTQVNYKVINNFKSPHKLADNVSKKIIAFYKSNPKIAKNSRPCLYNFCFVKIGMREDLVFYLIQNHCSFLSQKSSEQKKYA